MRREVVCQRIATANSRYALFKVAAECCDVAEMYNTDIWPVGAYVRRFYEPCNKSGLNGSNSNASLGEQMSGASLANGSEAS